MRSLPGLVGVLLVLNGVSPDGDYHALLLGNLRDIEAGEALDKDVPEEMEFAVSSEYLKLPFLVITLRHPLGN